MSIFEFDDQRHVGRLAGTLHSPGGTPGDVPTVQADGSLALKPGGGGSTPYPVTYLEVTAAMIAARWDGAFVAAAIPLLDVGEGDWVLGVTWDVTSNDLDNNVTAYYGNAYARGAGSHDAIDNGAQVGYAPVELLAPGAFAMEITFLTNSGAFFPTPIAQPASVYALFNGDAPPTSGSQKVWGYALQRNWP